MVRRSFCLAVVLTVLALLARLPRISAAPSIVSAANRCNAQTIDDVGRHLRDYERQPPGGGSTQLIQRYGSLADIASVLGEEREILDSVCSDASQRNALFAQIGALSAWALTLEADVAAKLNASCPAAAKALPTIMLADAWLALANVVNDQGGTVPSAINDVVQKVRSRADTVGLTLPPWSSTSAYWRDQVRDKARAAVATCPSPSPTPHGM